ncbi:MAG: efflux RND transporter periplasmic adaptor subunit [Patescibacteria group bacterium]|nr:efflux RND transporter periplasmic adaptor subunit [Patescibacteria group bacterium]
MIKPTRKNIILGLIIVAVVLMIWVVTRPRSSNYSYFEVKRGDIVQEVSATGNVTPVQSVDLGFEITGRVNKINVDAGSFVSKGQPLIYLDDSQLSAQLAGAEANLKAQQATLSELQQGTRPEQIKVQIGQVNSASVALNSAKKSLIDALNDSLTKSDDAIRNRVDQFISSPTTQNPDFLFFVNDLQLKNNALWERLGLESAMSSWKSMNAGLSVNSDFDSVVSKTNGYLSQVKSFLDDIASIVNSLTPNNNLSQTTITAYKTSVNTARNNVSLAISNLSGAYSSYSSARSNLTLQQDTLALQEAGTVPDQITAQEAVIQQAQANIDSYKAQLEETILRSPMDGVVTAQNLKVGEIVPLNSIAVSIISNGNFEVDVDIPEADIAKVKVGDSADITLDAYGSSVIFPAHVISIDPGETMVEGVATYKTTLDFDKKESRIKSGMTANIDILTARSTNTLYIPQRDLVSDTSGDYVLLLTSSSSQPQKKLVKVGIKGSDGNIEILSGLSEGDKVINSPQVQ